MEGLVLSAWLRPCWANLPGFTLQLKEREGMACSEDVLEMKFNWCSGEASLSAAYRKTLMFMETHPQGQSQAELLPLDVWHSWDHNLKILHNCPNHPRILRSEHQQVAWVRAKGWLTCTGGGRLTLTAFSLSLSLHLSSPLWPLAWSGMITGKQPWTCTELHIQVWGATGLNRLTARRRQKKPCHDLQRSSFSLALVAQRCKKYL